MRCADLDAALRVLKTRPSEPHKLTDEREAVVHGLFVGPDYEFKTVTKRVLSVDKATALRILLFLRGEITLEPIDGATYGKDVR